MMQPVTLLGCRASVNIVTELGSVAPATGVAVPVVWPQLAINIAVASAANSLLLRMSVARWETTPSLHTDWPAAHGAMLKLT